MHDSDNAAQTGSSGRSTALGALSEEGVTSSLTLAALPAPAGGRQQGVPIAWLTCARCGLYTGSVIDADFCCQVRTNKQGWRRYSQIPAESRLDAEIWDKGHGPARTKALKAVKSRLPEYKEISRTPGGARGDHGYSPHPLHDAGELAADQEAA